MSSYATLLKATSSSSSSIRTIVHHGILRRSTAACLGTIAGAAAATQFPKQPQQAASRRMSTATVPSTHHHHDSSSWSTNGSAAPSLLVGQQPPQQQRQQQRQRPNLINGGQQVKTHVNGNVNGHSKNINGLNGQQPTNGLNGSSSKKKNLVNGQNHTMNGHTVNGNGLTIVNGHEPNNAASLHVNGDGCTTSPQYESDLIVVLDMDECLIHSKFLSSKAASQWAYQVQRSHQEELEASHQQQDPEVFCDSFCMTLPDGDVVHVNKRPFLHSFLESLTSKYETHVFTAAMPVYASPVLDALDPHRTMFAQRWYRQDCTFCTNVGAYIKDLGRLPPFSPFHDGEDQHHQKRVVLVDNNPLSFLANPRNGILVSNFYDDPHDDTLEAVLELIHELNDCDDVRPTLDEKFGLEEALASMNNNSSSGNHPNTNGAGGGWQ